MTDKPKTGSKMRIGPRGLTLKRQKFARGLSEGLSQRDAYKRAFNAENMAPESIDTEASLLANDPEVSQRVEELLEEASAESDLSPGEVLEGLRALASKATTEQSYTAAIRAMELLGKAQGLFVDRVQNEDLHKLGDDEAIDKIVSAVCANPALIAAIEKRLSRSIH